MGILVTLLTSFDLIFRVNGCKKARLLKDKFHSKAQKGLLLEEKIKYFNILLVSETQPVKPLRLLDGLESRNNYSAF
jgi:hypothetical protein